MTDSHVQIIRLSVSFWPSLGFFRQIHSQDNLSLADKFFCTLPNCFPGLCLDIVRRGYQSFLGQKVKGYPFSVDFSLKSHQVLWNLCADISCIEIVTCLEN